MKLYANPAASNCWKVVMALEELGLDYEVETVDLLSGQNLTPSFLQLNPRGTVPVLQIDDLILRDSTDIMKHLDSLASPRSGIKLIPGHLGGVHLGMVLKFQKMLSELPVQALTYGLAFNQNRTKVVRWPYSGENFFENVRNYILTRGDKLALAIICLGNENDTAKLELQRKAEDNQHFLTNYLDEEGYDKVLKLFNETLGTFEDQLSSSSIGGAWLGGPLICMADITLGVILHRLWQLGLDEDFYSGGVRPHLSVFYQTIRNRESFKVATRWDVNTGERWMQQDGSPGMVDNAKMGLAMAAVLGGCYIVKKMLNR